MKHLAARPDRKRLGLLSLLVLLALLATGLHAAVASAENVPNPDEALIARWEPCEPNTGVTVIVDEEHIGTDKIYVGCALGEQSDGVEALQKAGFQIEGTREYGLAFICRIEDEPAPAEQTCEHSAPADAYWTYWTGKPGGNWSYSPVGALSPQSKGAINTVQGWGFTGGGGDYPRIEPVDGAGPSAFVLPPEQESSVIPDRLATQWLAGAVSQTAKMVLEGATFKTSGGKEEPVTETSSTLEQLLEQAIVLEAAGVQPKELEPLAELLAASCENVEGCRLREVANPEEPYPERYALAVLGLQALGQNTEEFAGMDLRQELEGLIDEATGKVKRGKAGTLSEAPLYTAPTLLALMRTGTGSLPAKALKTIDLILEKQNATTGSFEVATTANVKVIQALVAAREQGAGVLGQTLLEEVEAALVEAGAYLESIQEAGGGVRRRESASASYVPNLESTAAGAVGLALAGRQAAAERAARWVSQYQVTAEYAGSANPETGELTPALEVLGAFLPTEGTLRTAIAYGVPAGPYGPHWEAQLPTAQALLAFATAGPYGPYDAVFDQESLFFENRTVGSPSTPLTAILTNEDVRPVTVATVGIAGEQAGDFQLAGASCTGRTLQPGESCEAQVSFDPITSGLEEALLQATVQDTGQTIQVPVSGTGLAVLEREPEKESKREPEKQPEEKPSGQKETPPVQTGPESPPGGGGQNAGVLRVQTPRFDGQGAARGLVGVSWRILDVGPGVKSWTISSKALGSKSARYVTRDTGTVATSALVKLPPGRAYELRVTFTDVQGHSSTMKVGKVIVPEDDRWGGLHYRGRWHRLEQAGAWRGTVSRGGKGARVSVRLAAGRPVFMLRATSAKARVQVRAGAHHQTFTIAKGSASALRQITAVERSKAGTVTLRVLKGTVDLDGVADEG